MATIGIDIGAFGAKTLLGSAVKPPPSDLRRSLGVSVAAHLAVGVLAIALLRFLPSEAASDAPETIEVSIVSGLPEPAVTLVAEMAPAPSSMPAPEPVAESVVEPPVQPADPVPPPMAMQAEMVPPPAPVPLETATAAPVPAPAKPKPIKPVAKLHPKPMPVPAKPVEQSAPTEASSIVATPTDNVAPATAPAAVQTATAPSAVPAETHAISDETPPLILNPRFRESPAPPTYPKRAMELDQQGEALVRARLDTNGNPAEIVLWRTSGFDLLDNAALEAVRRWRFEPAQRDGHPIPAWVQVPIHFALK